MVFHRYVELPEGKQSRVTASQQTNFRNTSTNWAIDWSNQHSRFCLQNRTPLHPIWIKMVVQCCSWLFSMFRNYSISNGFAEIYHEIPLFQTHMFPYVWVDQTNSLTWTKDRERWFEDDFHMIPHTNHESSEVTTWGHEHFPRFFPSFSIIPLIAPVLPVNGGSQLSGEKPSKPGWTHG